MSLKGLRAPAPIRFVWDGQSLNTEPELETSMVPRAMHGRGVPWANIAVGGAGWYYLEADAPHMAKLAAEVRDRVGCTDVLVMNGGQSDIMAAAPWGQHTGAEAYAKAVSYKNAAKVLGYDIVVITSPPSFGPFLGHPTPTEAGYLTDLRNATLANTGSFDYVIDLDQPPMDAPSYGLDPEFFQFDNIHPNNLGAQVLADFCAPTIDDILS